MTITTTDQARAAFGAIIQESNALVGKPQTEQLTICRSVRSQVQALVTYTGSALAKVKSDESTAKEHLTAAHKKQTEVFKERTKLAKEQQEIYESVSLSLAEKRRLGKEKKTLDGKGEQLNRDLRDLQAEKTERIIGSIPVLNIGVAARRGEPELLIPFFDLFSGRLHQVNMVTQYTQGEKQKVDKDQRKVKDQIEDCGRKIVEKQRAVDHLKQKQSGLKVKVGILEEKVKECGAARTCLLNMQSDLQKILTDYRFLSEDIDFVELFSRENMLEQQSVSAMVQYVGRIQSAWLEVFSRERPNLIAPIDFTAVQSEHVCAIGLHVLKQPGGRDLIKKHFPKSVQVVLLNCGSKKTFRIYQAEKEEKRIILTAHTWVPDGRDSSSRWVHVREEDEWVKSKARQRSQWKLIPQDDGTFEIFLSRENAEKTILTVHAHKSRRCDSSYWVHVRKRDKWVRKNCSRWKLIPQDDGTFYIQSTSTDSKRQILTAHNWKRDKRDASSRWVHARAYDEWVLGKAVDSSRWKFSLSS